MNAYNNDQFKTLLLIGPGCPHCASLLEVLSKLVKQGEIAQLEIINVAQSPEVAQEFGVRSVPWLRIGEFEFDGARTEGEIHNWLKAIRSENSVGVYFQYLLTEGKLQKVIDMVKTTPGYLQALITLAKDSEQGMKVQLGVSAVFEDLEGSEILQSAVEDFGDFITNADSKIRADGAHFLSLTHSQNARPYLELLSNDESADVKEIAQEALDALTT